MFEVEVQAAKNFVEQPYTISLKNRRPTYRVCKQTLTYSKQEKISVSSSKILPRSAVWLDVRKSGQNVPKMVAIRYLQCLVLFRSNVFQNGRKSWHKNLGYFFKKIFHHTMELYRLRGVTRLPHNFPIQQ